VPWPGVVPQGAVAGDGAVGDAEQLDERKLLLQRLLERVGDEAVDGEGVLYGLEEINCDQLHGCDALEHGRKEEQGVGVLRALQRAHDHGGELREGGARLREAEGHGVDVEDGGAGADDGDEEGVGGVEGDGVAHEGEGEDGLEDAGADDVDAFAHCCRAWGGGERLWGKG
jgi:hypothetical protein